MSLLQSNVAYSKKLPLNEKKIGNAIIGEIVPYHNPFCPSGGEPNIFVWRQCRHSQRGDAEEGAFQ